MSGQKIRIVKKNDEYSMEYQVGDIFTIDSTWYGGVNVTSRTGIPLSLDKEEYEPWEDEGAGEREVDRYSYELGVMDVFCEMTAAGVKKLAMSHPCDTRQERDAYLPQVKRLCAQYGVKYYSEDEAFITDLFPAAANRGKYNFLFYRTDEVLQEYLRLKEEQRRLQENGGYTRQKSYETACAFGRLLSYPQEGIDRLIQKAAEADGKE